MVVTIRPPLLLVERNILKPTSRQRNLPNLRIHSTKLLRVTARQLIHGLLAHVDARSRVVDSQDVDGLALVRDGPAGTAVGRVPAGHLLDAADVGEVPDLRLEVPAVLGDEAVCAVGAGDDGHGAVGVVVAGVVGDWCVLMRVSRGREREKENIPVVAEAAVARVKKPRILESCILMDVGGVDLGW